MTAIALSLVNITKNFGAITALKNISLEAETGEFYFLLGPSGCGKTTLLKIIGGLEIPTEGSVIIHGKDVTDVSANKRNTAMVFQEWALFPHMNVSDNIAFGLRMRKIPNNEIKRRTHELLNLLHMADYEKRMPFELSGGQQQRIAMARALAIEPDILLLDEPLSNLDLTLRQQMRVELVRLHKKIGKTFIYVTHDQTEALSMASMIAVMKAGEIIQLGTPKEIYESPINDYVAKFIGEANKLLGTIRKINSTLAFQTDSGMILDANIENEALSENKKAIYIIRPEHIKLLSETDTRPTNFFRGEINNFSYFGKQMRLWVRLQQTGDILFMDVPSTEIENVQPGRKLTVGWNHARSICFIQD
jgi:spermidine/putrescine transport system ATP-binding protein